MFWNDFCFVFFWVKRLLSFLSLGSSLTYDQEVIWGHKEKVAMETWSKMATLNRKPSASREGHVRISVALYLLFSPNTNTLLAFPMWTLEWTRFWRSVKDNELCGVSRLVSGYPTFSVLHFLSVLGHWSPSPLLMWVWQWWRRELRSWLMCKCSCVSTVFSQRRLGVGGRRCCSVLRAVKHILFVILVLFLGLFLENTAVKFTELFQKVPLGGSKALEGLASLMVDWGPRSVGIFQIPVYMRWITPKSTAQ